ncbi:MAG: zf-HC2 domain-containing protein [Deltaproteobacteria bacterium]|nr:zf-HC2 domain-containing protein [Deltaproteobacteria bacterium]
MTHENARELLLDLAYGELSPAEARAVEAHLAGCEDCRAERDRIAATRQLMQGLGEEEPPGGERILLAAARQAVERPRRAPLFSWVRFATGLAILMIVGGVTMELLSARRPAVDDAEERYAERSAAAPAPGLTLEAPPVQRAPAAPPLAAAPPVQRAPAAPAYAAAPPRAKEERQARPADESASAPGDEARAAEPGGIPMPSPGAAGSASEVAVARPRAAGVAPESKGASAGPQAAASLREGAPGVGFSRQAAPAPAAAPAASRAEAADAERALPAREPARKVASRDEPAAAAGAEGAALVAEVTRLRDGGLLNEARRRPEPCPGGDTARLAWLDGLGVARRFARTGPLPAAMGAGEATRDQWYDTQGRLRYAVIEGEGPEGRFRRRILLDPAGAVRSEDPPGGAPWPRADLTLRDPAAAFWAPQRCTGR